MGGSSRAQTTVGTRGPPQNTVPCSLVEQGRLGWADNGGPAGRSGRSSAGHSWRDPRGNPCWPRRYLRWRREGVIVGKHILWSRPGWDGGCREGGCGPHRHRNEGRPRCGAPHCGWAARRVHTGHRSALWSGAVAAGVLEPSIIDRWGHRRGHGAGADVPNDVERFLECMVHAQHIVPPLSLLS